MRGLPGLTFPQLKEELRSFYAPCCIHPSPLVEKGRDEVYTLAAPDINSDDFAMQLAQMVKDVWHKKGMPKTINKTVATAFAKELWGGTTKGYGSDIGNVDYDTPDYNMLESLQKNVWQFSAAKNHQQLKDLSQALIGDDGKLRSYNEFKRTAYEINDKHINQWLKTEYDTAVAGGQMAGKWVDITEKADTLPLLEFDAVLDERTTELCGSLNGVVRPINDAFWDVYYPPNHFNCRSTVRQRGNETHVTAQHTIAYPEIPAMFKTNLAKQGLIFPKGHAYFKGVPKNVLNSFTPEMNESVTNFIDDENVQSTLDITVYDDYGIKDAFDIKNTNLLNLAGGVPAEEVTNFEFYAKSINNSVYKAEISCDEFVTNRTIDFENKSIYNDYMRVHDKGKGIGLNLFVNQVKAARALGFDTLQVHAAGGAGEMASWDGYYFWAKVGYQLDEDYADAFIDWAQQRGFEEKALNDLVKKKELLKVWQNEGFEWWGSFDLSDGSDSMKYLQDYLQSRGMSVSF